MPARPPVVTRRLALWWGLAGGVVVALAFAWTDHMLRAAATFAAALAAAAVARALAPTELAGGLVVRSRWLDVAVLVALSVTVAAIGLSLDLRAQV
ncbi:MAG TPA: DUF3017 domain-containing protein [Dermatophilaceae bacterium]|nr:DUF3017 domain-containing protein [Dermatophilaceae bacterium]